MSAVFNSRAPGIDFHVFSCANEIAQTLADGEMIAALKELSAQVY